MFATLLSFSLSDVIPYIKNKGEATALISTIIVSQQLSSATRVLQISIAQELLLADLQEDASIASKELKHIVAVCPLIYTALSLVKQRFPVQVAAVNNHLDDLCRISITLEQYSEQNMALARELEHADCIQLSEQKFNIATFEQEICRRIGNIKSLSRENGALEMPDLLSTYPPLCLKTTSIARNKAQDNVAIEIDASLRATANVNYKNPIPVEEERIGSSARKTEFHCNKPTNSGGQFFSDASISPSFSADHSINRERLTRGVGRHQIFEGYKEDGDSLFRSGRDKDFDFDSGQKSNHQRFDDNYSSINDISCIKFIDPSQDNYFKDAFVDSSGETNSKCKGDIDYGKQGKKKDIDTSNNDFRTNQIADSCNVNNKNSQDAALDIQEMSPPPGSKPDNSTPTSSQTAFGGDNEESHNYTVPREGGMRGLKRGREAEGEGEREIEMGSSTISSDDPCGHILNRVKGNDPQSYGEKPSPLENFSDILESRDDDDK